MFRALGKSAVVLPLVFAAGCSSEPTDLVASARTSVREAKTTDPAEYAPERFQEMLSTVAMMDEELRIQESKFFLFRNYDQTRVYAAQTDSMAQVVTATATETKERAREEAQLAMDMADEALTRTQQMLVEAVGGKGTVADLAAMRVDHETMDATLDRADSAFSAEKFVTARTLAEEVLDRADELQTELEAARTAKRTGSKI